MFTVGTRLLTCEALLNKNEMGIRLNDVKKFSVAFVCSLNKLYFR